MSDNLEVLSASPWGVCSRCGNAPRPAPNRYYCNPCNAAYQRGRNAKVKLGLETTPSALKTIIIALDAVSAYVEDESRYEKDAEGNPKCKCIDTPLLVARQNLEKLADQMRLVISQQEEAAKQAENAAPVRGRPAGSGEHPTVGPLSPTGGPSPAAMAYINELKGVRPWARAGYPDSIVGWDNIMTNFRRKLPWEADRVPTLSEYDPAWDEGTVKPRLYQG
jgi:hypothetical protein